MKTPVTLPAHPDADEATMVPAPDVAHLDERSAASIRKLSQLSHSQVPPPGDWPDREARQEPVEAPSRPDVRKAFKIPEVKNVDGDES